MIEAIERESPYFAGSYSLAGLQETYGRFFSARQGELEAQLAAKDGELSRLVDAYADLKGRAKEKAKERTEAIEAEMTELQGRLENLAEKMAGLERELAAKSKAIEQAKRILTGQVPLKKAEALQAVVAKVFCHFVPLDKPGQLAKDKLDRMEIVPVIGDPISYQSNPFGVDDSPWPI
jgi:DNA repair exonuclease SbcCD ATPase subunit